VTLPTWILRVKQVRRDLLLALVVSALVSGALLRLHGHDSAMEADNQALGESLAAGLAGLAVEPLTNRDRIALGVLANRLVALDQISGITIYTVDDEMMAISGDSQRGYPVTQAITQDNSVVGYVRIMLISNPTSDDAGYTGLGLAITLLLPLLVVSLWQMPWQRLRLPAAPVDAPNTVPEAPPPPPVAHGLLALNLFNQLTLKPEIREQELAHAQAVAESVADLYAANVSLLPGTGLLLSFDGSADPERPFQVLCAAFLLARLLADAESHGQYRLGLHTVTLPANNQAPTDLAEIQDAALLSAVARPKTLAVSDALFASIEQPDRVMAEPMRNPLLNQLESTEPKAWLVAGLDDLYQQQLDGQVRELGYSSAPATPSESTF
jgi:hypothetical protein